MDNNTKTAVTAAQRSLPVVFHAGQTFQPKIRQRMPSISLLTRPDPTGLLRTMPALLLLLVALVGTPHTSRAVLPGASVDMNVLVVAATADDYSLPSIREALDFLGTPYHVHVATELPGSLISDTLRSGTRGFYTGIILSSASLSYSPDNGTTWLSALSATEWAVLEQYELDFGARRLNWYAYPGPAQGFNWPTASLDTTGSPIQGQWTADGAANFVYLNTQNTYPIENVWAYLATPLDTGTSVWMSDGNGNALLAAKTFADGREMLTKTFDSATWQLNSSVLYHGLVNWVCGGIFPGQRHTYLTAQVDDVFLADDIFTGGEYRQNSNDWHATIAWQQRFNQRQSGVNFRYDMAFNGLGTEPGQYVPDDLTPYAAATESVFKWISHTFSHPYLTEVTYAQAMPEIVQNNQKAVELGLTEYSIKSMVTPNITGLENPDFLNAAYDSGIRYLVTDTSIEHHRAPSPNTGIPNWYVPGILMIPRHANNLFYNVSTPAQWEAEYNFIYRGYWGRDLTYAEILDDQSDLLLRALLKGDVSPQMFHQPNLRDYDGQGRTLLGDLLDAVADKYEFYYNFPFLSPTQDELGETVQWRMDYNNSGVRVSRHADGSISLSVQSATVVPVTGMKTPDAEAYAGQWITYVALADGEAKTFTPDGQGGFLPPATANNPPVAVAVSAGTDSVTPINLTLSGSDPDGDPVTFAVAGAPTLGTLTGQAPDLVYTPSGTAGTDIFSFTVSDGEFTVTATVTVEVTAYVPNQAPAAGDISVSVQTRKSVSFALPADDPDNDPLAYTIVSGPGLGTLSGTAPDLTYTAGRNTGTDTITYSVSDGEYTDTATVTITITGKTKGGSTDDGGGKGGGKGRK